MNQAIAVLTEKPFTQKEKDLLKELTRPEATIEVTVADNITPEEWMQVADVTCRALMRAQRQEQALMPVFGRLLLIAKEHPEIWQGNRYDGFENFITATVREKWGIGRSTCYEAMRLASRFPEMEVVEYQDIGRLNMRILDRAIPKGEEKKKFAKDLLAKAKELTTSEFREYCEERLYLDPGETQGTYIRMPSSMTTAKLWAAFISDPRIQAVCKTAKPDRILKHMMEECRGEWNAAGQDLLDHQAEVAATAAGD